MAEESPRDRGKGGDSLTTLGRRADRGDEPAMERLSQLAAASGIDPDEYETWRALASKLAEGRATEVAKPSGQSSSRSAASAAAGAVRKSALTTWEGIWYVLMCIALGAGYFAKIPAKKALQDFGLVDMSSAERFWYVLQCIFLGAGYFAKIPTAKALSELPQYRSQRDATLGTLS